MTQALIAKPQTQQVSVSRYNDEDLRHEIGIYKAAFPRSRASDPAIRALMIAAKFSGLNPFRGEIYYVDDVGIMVASKIKAADAVDRQRQLGNTLNVKFERVTPAMTEIEGSVFAKFAGRIAPGDTARACRIISSHQRRDYYDFRRQLSEEGRGFGYSGRELEAWVNEKAGPAPEIITLGIVKAGENFGDEKKSRYAREDRADKRALQLALNIAGYAAPDMRNYGGVQIHDEQPEDGGYTVKDAVTPEPVQPGVEGGAEFEDGEVTPSPSLSREDAVVRYRVAARDAKSRGIDLNGSTAQTSDAVEQIIAKAEAIEKKVAQFDAEIDQASAERAASAEAVIE